MDKFNSLVLNLLDVIWNFEQIVLQGMTLPTWLSGLFIYYIYFLIFIEDRYGGGGRNQRDNFGGKLILWSNINMRFLVKFWGKNLTDLRYIVKKKHGQYIALVV